MWQLLAMALGRAARAWPVAAVATAILIAAVLVVPRLLADRDEPAPVGHPRELARHGGPWVLPAPTDDEGHGFGTRSAATRAPSSPAPGSSGPEAAWICRYDVREVGRTDTGGTE